MAGLYFGSLAVFASIVATWLPLALIFAVTWLIGVLVSTLPWQEPSSS